MPDRNPHSGRPFTEDDVTIAAALEVVSIPALLCSLVHITGDPTWIRSELRPQGSMLNEYQGYMSEEAKAEVRRRALPVLAEYRDRGCTLPAQPDAALAREMMAFLACAEVPEVAVPMFLEDLHLDGSDSGAISWRDEVPAAVRDRAHTVVIGCGEAGLLAGIRLAQAGVPFTIIEKNLGPGGTWWENRYPGARVDVGSHFYCYSFEPADHWTEYFSQHSELRAYFETIMHKYGIESHCRFGEEVIAARFDDETRRWTVTTKTASAATSTIDAQFVISAVGALNRPKLPDIEGIEDFTGPKFHSARWDASVDYTDARVALIGAGASGFQIAPTIAPEVAQLTVFQRTAQWMFPNPGYHDRVPDGERWAMRHLPFYARWFRFLTFYPAAGIDMSSSRVDPNYDDSDGVAINEMNLMARHWFESWIREGVGDDPELLAKVLPDYPATAKRTLQDNGSWLACLRRPNVELVRTGIERIVADGVITTDGQHYPADIICFATGFRHAEYLWPMTITGRDGVDLREQWGEEPSAYLGITVPRFPNFFCLYGPGTNLAHGGSLIFQSECQVNYVMEALRATLAEGASTVEVDQKVHDEYLDRYSNEISQLVWAHPSVKHSHFKNRDGRVFTLSPWPIPTYWAWTKHFASDEYQLR